MALLPWHANQWQQLAASEANERLPHALLLEGPAATGKRQFADAFAQYLLCSEPHAGSACGKCHSCQLVAVGNHPDLVLLQPEEPGKAIKVDDIRAFVAGATLTPQIARRRVTLITPAEAMNQAAANSLLKTLEEPNQENHILLISHAPWDLPATIRSRCQRVSMSLPDREVAVSWLNSQQATGDWPEVLDCVQGAPLKALEFYQQQGLDRYRNEKRRFASLIAGRVNAVEVGAAWSKDDTGLLADWIYRWTIELIRAHESNGGASRDDELQAMLKDLIPRLDSARLFTIIDRFSMLQRGIRIRNLNAQMQYEALATELMEAGR